MSFFNWLLGKKDGGTAVAERGSAGSGNSSKANGKRPTLEADNLRRWTDSGQLRAWVVAHKGQWGHGEWLNLLEELKRSPFWPMQTDAVGAALEEGKREWLRRK